MGYILKIGEAMLDYDEESVSVNCLICQHADSPAFGDPTDHESQRWPSYTAWSEAMERLGLMDVMFNVRNGGAGVFRWNGRDYEPLMREHPGVAPITKAHVEYVEQKIKEYKSANPGVMAGYYKPKHDAVPVMPGSGLYREEDMEHDPLIDPWLARGEWLAWWLRWAIENCKQPVFVNV